MKTLLLVGTAAVLIASASAQPAPGAAPVAPGAKPAPGAPAAKPKPYTSSDARIYIATADGIQFQLKMSERMRGRYKDGPTEMQALSSKIYRDCVAIWTPGVDAAMAHGVDGKKIPNDMSKADKTALGKVGAIKDAKASEQAFFDFFAKESKKYAVEIEKDLKNVQDPDLKAFVEKSAALLKAQSEEIDAKAKGLKGKK